MSDYIEREAVLRRLESCVGWSRPSESAYEDIQAMPAADVVPVVHGKWEVFDGCSNEGVYCSVCHKKVYKVEYANKRFKAKCCPNCGAKMDKEDNMSENKKPRLAEVLGVEVGEVFYILDYPVDYGPVAVESDGKLRRVHGDGGRGNKVGANALYHLINQPECLSRRPRWTKQEVKDAKAIQRILPEARDIDRITETLTVVRDEDGFCLLTLQKDMFPNVKEGQAAKLADVIGGNT